MILLIIWNNNCISSYDIYCRLGFLRNTSNGLKNFDHFMIYARVLHLIMIGVDYYKKAYLYTYVSVANTHGSWFLRKGAPSGVRVLFGYISWLDTYTELVRGLVRIKERAPQKHMFKRDYTTPSKFDQNTPFSTMNTTREVHILGGCTVLNMYTYTWVHIRGINLNIAVLRLHTINTFKIEKNHVYLH